MAYELRISDWSSDVCSSDRPARRDRRPVPAEPEPPVVGAVPPQVLAMDPEIDLERLEQDRRPGRDVTVAVLGRVHDDRRCGLRDEQAVAERQRGEVRQPVWPHGPNRQDQAGPVLERGISEEHTSELQSLVRQSYSVL